LAIAQEAVDFFITTMEEDFGYPAKDASIFFSGSRGYHVHYGNLNWITDEHLELEEHLARQQLMNYLTLVREHKDSKKRKKLARDRAEHDEAESEEEEEPESIDPALPPALPIARLDEFDRSGKIASTQLEYRVKTWVAQRFLLQTPRKAFFEDLPWKRAPKVPKTDLLSYLTKLRHDAETIQPFLLKPNVFRRRYGLDYTAALRMALVYRYPRFDVKPTIDTKRIIKIPGTVDGSTGYLVQRIPYDQLYSIGLSDLLTVDHFV
jgi:DNA primase catalytic subunit